MHAPSLHTLLDALEHDAALRKADALRERLDALDRIELLQLGGAPGPGASALRIAALREDFEAMNAASFAHAREAIRRGFRFVDFDAAFAFMARTALLAAKMDHHPEWSNVYNKVDVTLATHDAGGVTQKDIDLATAMDGYAALLSGGAGKN